MGIERQNIQLRLAFPEWEWGEAPGTSGKGSKCLWRCAHPKARRRMEV